MQIRTRPWIQPDPNYKRQKFEIRHFQIDEVPRTSKRLLDCGNEPCIKKILWCTIFLIMWAVHHIFSQTTKILVCSHQRRLFTSEAFCWHILWTVPKSLLSLIKNNPTYLFCKLVWILRRWGERCMGGWKS